MGHVFNNTDAARFDAWQRDCEERQALALQALVAQKLLRPFPGNRLLEVGCKSGRFLKFFQDAGFVVDGLDPSQAMLDLARKNAGPRVHLHQGFGEHLPFDDNSFDVAALMLSLEFADDPEKTFAEAVRVARRRVLVLCLNRYAVKGVADRMRGAGRPAFFEDAHAFGLWDLKRLVRKVLGNVPVTWRTACHFPGVPGLGINALERSSVIQRSPFGEYLVLAAECSPRLITASNPLIIKPKTAAKLATGAPRAARKGRSPWKRSSMTASKTARSDAASASTAA